MQEEIIKYQVGSTSNEFLARNLFIRKSSLHAAEVIGPLVKQLGTYRLVSFPTGHHLSRFNTLEAGPSNPDSIEDSIFIVTKTYLTAR